MKAQQPQARKPSTALKKKTWGFAERRVTNGEEEIGNKKIPFLKIEQGGGWVETIYGCSGVWKFDRPEILTCLVKTVKLGHTEWKTVSTNRVLSHGSASNKLQGNKYALALFYNVKKAREMAAPGIEIKFETSGLKVTTAPNSFEFLFDLLVLDIRNGDTQNIQNIAKCIEAVVQQEEKSKTDRILSASRALAIRLNRLPTKNEIRYEFDDSLENTFSDEGNFMRALEAAGLAWLPTKPPKTHKGP
jgi:hypothetical protein